MRYFKYGMKSHIQGMLNKGQIRIGTLYGYRSVEKLEIQDEFDGKAVAKTSAGYKEFAPGEEVRLLGFPLIKNIDGKGNVVKKIDLKLDAEVHNCYVYCLSNEASKDIMTRTKYNACLEILDIGKFINCLRKGLSPLGLLNTAFAAHADKCVYTINREIYYESSPHFKPKEVMKIALLKTKKDEYQKEFRILIAPFEGQAISHVDTVIPELRSLVRRVNL